MHNSMPAQNLSGSKIITNLGKECDRLVSKAASVPTALYKKTLLKVTSQNLRIVSKPLQKISYMTRVQWVNRASVSPALMQKDVVLDYCLQNLF